MTKIATPDILTLTDQDKRRLRRDVLAEYAAWVDQVSEDCDFKTEFSQEEIAYKNYRYRYRETAMSQEMKHNKTKITVVSYDEFTDDDFNPPSTYFVLAASGDYYFIHTSKRDVAQDVVNDHFGHNRYKVKASRLQKGSGGVTAR